MNWAAIVAWFLKLVVGFSNYLSNRQLLDAGKAQAENEQSKEVLERVRKANEIRDRLANDPDYADVVRMHYSRKDSD